MDGAAVMKYSDALNALARMVILSPELKALVQALKEAEVGEDQRTQFITIKLDIINNTASSSMDYAF
jgi:hypothetical protein